MDGDQGRSARFVSRDQNVDDPERKKPKQGDRAQRRRGRWYMMSRHEQADQA
jgi:hypothetical protein